MNFDEVIDVDALRSRMPARKPRRPEKMGIFPDWAGMIDGTSPMPDIYYVGKACTKGHFRNQEKCVRYRKNHQCVICNQARIRRYTTYNNKRLPD